MTWVVADFSATPGTNEVSVTKGQQVEIIDMNCNGAPEYCLVRLSGPNNSNGTTTSSATSSQTSVDGNQPLEGLVPISVLKPAPTGKTTHRRAIDGNSDNKESTENSGKFLFVCLFSLVCVWVNYCRTCVGPMRATEINLICTFRRCCREQKQKTKWNEFIAFRWHWRFAIKTQQIAK